MGGSRRIAGLDLGVATAHTAQVLDEHLQVIAKRRITPTAAGFEALEEAALASAVEGTRLEVVIEPTGTAWLPVAVWFTRRGHTVFRVSTRKAADLRRFLSRHAKSSTIDAHTLARLPLIDPDGLRPVALPASAAAASLDRRVRAAAGLSDEIGTHKGRLIELARQAMPTIGTALTSGLARCDLAVLERYGDPRRLAKVRRDRLVAFIAKISHNQSDPTRKAEAFLQAARDAVALYGDDPAISFDALADEIASEVRIIRMLETERAKHAHAREDAYLAVDPDQLARSLPGLATVGAPMLLAVMGDPARFYNAAAFKSYLGLTPRASRRDRPQGPADVEGRKPTDAYPDVAIRRDRPPARPPTRRRLLRPDRQQGSGAHQGARRGRRPTRRTQLGRDATRHPLRRPRRRRHPVDRTQARRITAERYTVPEEIRRQRRSKKKGGRAPRQVLEGRASGQRSKRDNTRRPSQPRAFPGTATASIPAAT